MALSGDIEARRHKNAAVFERMGISAQSSGTILKTVREGTSTTLFTIGYEKRSLDDLIAALRDAGVTKLIDVREKPISRKPDFRKNAIADACANAHIEYESWVRLGSTATQREFLKDSGDIPMFMKKFRAFARNSRSEELQALAEEVKQSDIALLCYERAHDECHRSVIAELVAEIADVTIIAIQ